MGDYDFPRSVSQRREYQACGYRWFLHRVQGYRMRRQLGRFSFGDVMQQVADAIVRGACATPAAASAYFEALWALLVIEPALQQAAGQPAREFAWAKTKPWEWYRERGRALAALAAKELPARIFPKHAYGEGKLPVCVVNQPVRFTIEGVQEVAIPDLVTFVQRKANGTWQEGSPVLTVLDWKTAAGAYDDFAPELDEQLVEYQLACAAAGLPPVEQLGLVVFVTTSVPQIQWLLVPPRNPEQIQHHLARVVTTDRMIRDGVFIQNPRACFDFGGCDFQSVCFPSQAHRREAELVRDPAKVRDEQDLALEWD